MNDLTSNRSRQASLGELERSLVEDDPLSTLLNLDTTSTANSTSSSAAGAHDTHAIASVGKGVLPGLSSSSTLQSQHAIQAGRNDRLFSIDDDQPEDTADRESNESAAHPSISPISPPPQARTRNVTPSWLRAPSPAPSRETQSRDRRAHSTSSIRLHDSPSTLPSEPTIPATANPNTQSSRPTLSLIRQPSSSGTSLPGPSTSAISSRCSPALGAHEFLAGEQRLAHMQDIYLQNCLYPFHNPITTKGSLSPTKVRLDVMNFHEMSYFHVPMACIDRTEKEISKRHPSRDPGFALLIVVKDGRILRILLSDSVPGAPSHAQTAIEGGLDRLKALIDAYAFPADVARHLFCFHHFKALAAANSELAVPAEGLTLRELKAEYVRQFTRSGGLSWLEGDKYSCAPCPWRISRLNERYGLCTSYPALLVVPRDASDDELIACAQFRSENRLPALTWGSSTSSASIWRSSQPKVGFGGNTCKEDEKVLFLIGAGERGMAGQAHTIQGIGVKMNGYDTQGASLSREPPHSDTAAAPRFIDGVGVLRIHDLRHRSAALANRATGHGYEQPTAYPNSQLTFFNIGNVHVMRDSITRLQAMIQSTSINETDWTTVVESTKWLTHLRLCLTAAYRTAAAVVRDKASVLLHCSHGWDRTSQVASLAQLMIDPYYRTFAGFEVLIEKDWLAFGHPFHLRIGHGLLPHMRNDDQLAPIFLQFLDCVYQLHRLHPYLFEFSTRYLLLLADHIYDCRFGTFLCNTPRERAYLRDDLRQPTPSIWAYLQHHRTALSNPAYITVQQPVPDSSTLHAQHEQNYRLPCAAQTDPRRTSCCERTSSCGCCRTNNISQRILDTPLPHLLRRVQLWGDYWFQWSAHDCHSLERRRSMEHYEEAQSEKRPDWRLPWIWAEEEQMWNGYHTSHVKRYVEQGDGSTKDEEDRAISQDSRKDPREDQSSGQGHVTQLSDSVDVANPDDSPAVHAITTPDGTAQRQLEGAGMLPANGERPDSEKAVDALMQELTIDI